MHRKYEKAFHDKCVYYHYFLYFQSPVYDKTEGGLPLERDASCPQSSYSECDTS